MPPPFGAVRFVPKKVPATTGALGSVEYVPGGDVTRSGSPVLLEDPVGSGIYHAVFARRKDHATAGLTYAAQFSAELEAWTASTATPAVLTGAGSPGDIEVVSIPYPSSVPLQAGGTQAPKFFRVGVSSE